ncbi:MAG TPA: prenyltransferase/squalene oxidase repeat-containing protein, partial [Desulfobacteria bacterium]|nr:prenyltransferase/squalene oxidase repeat-containing protein [Desulfobacteria bacterium]
EDILITSLCVLCLSLTGHYPSAYVRGVKWLASVQYQSGAWPGFNQLTNWDTGLAAFAASEFFTEKPGFITDCAEYLNIRANQDGSYGTLSPYSFPDLDDTAMALLGLSAADRYDTRFRGRIAQTGQLVLSLQNQDGSWSTFPEVTENPPYCTCILPAHIKSVDVTVHVLQALIKSGIGINHPQIQKALWWLSYQQRWDGSWKSTWYIGNSYATAQALELLADYGLWPKTRLKARKWLIAAQNEKGAWPIGSAGECGLAIASLLKNGESPESPVIVSGLNYLTSLQQPDGSFKPAYGGLYAGGLYYEDPVTEAIAALRAIKIYLEARS